MFRLRRLIEKGRVVGPFFEGNIFDNLSCDDNAYSNLLAGYKPVNKDFTDGEKISVTKLLKYNRELGSVEILTDKNINITLNVKKEKRFFDILFNLKQSSDIFNFLDDMKQDERDIFEENTVNVVVEKQKNNQYTYSLSDCYVQDRKEELIQAAKNKSEKIYYAKVYDRNSGGFFCVIDGVNVFLPGSLASANRIYNFDEYMQKTIPVMMEDYLYSGDTLICSYKKYLKNILPEKIKLLDFESEIEGKVTGTTKFSIFIEFDDIFTGLLYKTEMDDYTKQAFERNEIKPDNKLNFYIKEILDNNRIVLTQTRQIDPWILFAQEYEGKILEGTIDKVKDYGSIIVFNPDGFDNTFKGLILKKNIGNDIEYSDFVRREKHSFIIENVSVKERKIKLRIFRDE